MFTFDEFINKYTGVAVDFDGYYGTQCMDLMHQYVYEVLGEKDATVLAAWCAKAVFENFKWSNLFTKIENTPKGVPQKGDIMFWGGGDFGHVAIFIEGDATSFTSFDANFPLNSMPHKQFHYYGNVLGWLRFKDTGEMDTLLKKISDLEEKLAGWVEKANSRQEIIEQNIIDFDNLKILCEDWECKYKAEKTFTKELTSKVSTLSHSIETLKKCKLSLELSVELLKDKKYTFMESLVFLFKSLGGGTNE